MQRVRSVRDVALAAGVSAVVGVATGLVMNLARDGAPGPSASGGAPGGSSGDAAPDGPLSRVPALARRAGAARAAHGSETTTVALPGAAPRPPAADFDGDDGVAPPGASPVRSPEERALIVDSVIVAPFEAEGRDPSWAVPRERAIDEELSRFVATGVAGVSAGSLECRTSRCRLELRYTDEAAREATNDAILARTLFDTDCTLHSIGPDDSAAPPSQTLYFECAG